MNESPPQKIYLLTACFKVMDLEEIEDANALATSLAPIRKPYAKPRIPPKTAIQRYSVSFAMVMKACSNELAGGTDSAESKSFYG